MTVPTKPLRVTRDGIAYRCCHCGEILRYNRSQAWIESYCDIGERLVHLMRVDKEPNNA